MMEERYKSKIVVDLLLKRKNMLKFVFSVNKYKGILINNEPEKCKELKWFEVEKLPENIIPKNSKGSF